MNTLKDATAVVSQLVTPAGFAEPYGLYAEAHQLGPVTSFWGDKVFVSGYEAFRELLRHPAMASTTVEAFSPGLAANFSRQLLRHSLIKANNPHHARMRTLMASLFTPRRLAALEPAIDRAVERLIDEMVENAADGAVDFMADFAWQLPLDVVCELLGAPKNDLHRLRALVTDFSWAFELKAGKAELDIADRASQEMLAFFAELVAERRAEPRDDLITDLIKASDAESPQLSSDELTANVITVLVGGSQTITHWLGNTLILMFEHQDTVNELRNGELDVADFLDETLRFDSPAQMMPRITVDEVTLPDGSSIPPETGVLFCMGAANRDPSRYERPNEFDPRRPNVHPVSSFGFGAHFCLGARLARLEGSIAIPSIVKHFPGLDLAGDPVRSRRTALRGYDSIPISFGRPSAQR